MIFIISEMALTLSFLRDAFRNQDNNGIKLITIVDNLNLVLNQKNNV